MIEPRDSREVFFRFFLTTIFKIIVINGGVSTIILQ